MERILLNIIKFIFNNSNIFVIDCKPEFSILNYNISKFLAHNFIYMNLFFIIILIENVA